jgi:hypothetical protein
MRIIIVTLALLSGAVFFSAENANAQGCPTGQREMGRCIAGPKPPSGNVEAAPAARGRWDAAYSDWPLGCEAAIIHDRI